MKKTNKFFYLTYIFIAITIISLIILIMRISDLNSNKSLSKSYFQEAFFQKEKEFSDLVYTYTTSIRSLHENPYLHEYIVNNDDQKITQEIFLHDKKSLPLFFQVRYLDNNGNEKIRVDGDAIALYKNEARSHITPKNELQNKSDKDYFQKFMKLSPGEVGYSIIDLNQDNGMVTLPKEPTLRIGMALYGDKKEPQGVLIYNVSLRHFFIHLSQSLHFNFMMIDKAGNFLVHYNEKYGLLGTDCSYSLKDEFPDDYKNILANNRYETNSLFSGAIDYLENTQDIKMIITFQADDKNNLTRWLKENSIMLMIFLAFVSLPLAHFIIYKEKNANHLNCR